MLRHMSDSMTWVKPPETASSDDWGAQRALAPGDTLTTHAHVVVLKVVISQQSKPVGIGGCVPLTTQTQVVVLKVAVS